MIYAYGITQQGTYHIKHNIVCQDAHQIVKCGDGLVIAAVADGLGSEAHSDIASKLAVKTAAECCAQRLIQEWTDEQLLDTLRSAFAQAQSAIERTAAENGHPLDQYDTTLSLAVLKDDTLYYGHSGDSGIVALNADGTYEAVTQQQRDTEGRVFPLYFGVGMWVFEKYPKPVASVLLATDGMFETLFPFYIRSEPVSIYVALARYFMDPGALGIVQLGEAAVQAKIGGFLERIPDSQVNDDKTVVVLVNPEVKTSLQPPDYYAEPDWQRLKKQHEESWKRTAYPHLFGGSAGEQTPEAADPPEAAAPEAGTPAEETPESNLTEEEDPPMSGREKRIFLVRWFRHRGQADQTNERGDTT